MSDNIAAKARLAIRLWEMNPKRVALAKWLGIEPGQVTDAMIKRAEEGFNHRDPNVQQIPRSKR
jgi:hypothetical protein